MVEIWITRKLQKNYFVWPKVLLLKVLQIKKEYHITVFSGKIKWSGADGKVRNADFMLTDDGILWLDGTWESGTWYAGEWKKGMWKKGTWVSGTWKDGTWWNGTWEDGTWEKGTWKNGTWEFGTDKNGETYGEDYSPNFW